MYLVVLERKEQKNMFHAGDKVAHPGHGGCIIQGVCDKEFGGITKRYYVLIPKMEPNTTILDPVDNAQKIGLRGIISPQQADQLLRAMSGFKVSWIKENTKRRQAFDKILKEGELSDVAQMIKELTVQNQISTLNNCDKATLNRAHKKLVSELALAKGVSFEEALELVNEAIAGEGEYTRNRVS